MKKILMFIILVPILLLGARVIYSMTNDSAGSSEYQKCIDEGGQVLQATTPQCLSKTGDLISK